MDCILCQHVSSCRNFISQITMHSFCDYRELIVLQWMCAPLAILEYMGYQLVYTCKMDLETFSHHRDIISGRKFGEIQFMCLIQPLPSPRPIFVVDIFSRFIRAGSELTWDYGYQPGIVEGKVMYCYCGSSNCRGRLL